MSTLKMKVAAAVFTVISDVSSLIAVTYKKIPQTAHF